MQENSCKKENGDSAESPYLIHLNITKQTINYEKKYVKKMLFDGDKDVFVQAGCLLEFSV